MWLVIFYVSQGSLPLAFLGSFNLVAALLFILAGMVLTVTGVARRTPTVSSTALSDRTSTLAVVALVLAFFASVPAVICGHLALGEISRTNERGRGLAIAALWIGYISIVVFVVVGAIYFALVFGR